MKFRNTLLTTVMFISLILLCYSPLNSKRVEPNQAVIDGFKLAQQCKPSNVELSHLKLYVVNDKNILIFWIYSVIGLTILNRIYVVESEINNKNTWAHEFVHSFGVLGHPDKYFKRCYL